MAKKITSKNKAKRKSPTKKRGKAKKAQTRRRWITWTVSAAAVFILLSTLFIALVFLGVLGPVPSKQQLHVINNPVASEVFSADGKVLGRYYVENRSTVTFNDISPNVINALIATEDARFYEHRGIDEIALMRVLVKSILLQNSSAGGGSTLSQQIAKNLFPRVDYGPMSLAVNKLRESIIAYRLERIYTKQEILSLYLNTVPFAENVFGIEVAAERFFSKTPAQLNIPEAAVLVGMLKANNYYNPRTHPQRAKGRRDVVIDQMAKYAYISEQQAESFKMQPLEVEYRIISYNQGPAPYFLQKLRPQLLEWCNTHTKPNGDPYNLYTDGLKIKTTLDYNLQVYAQLAVKEYMKDLQKVFDNHWKDRDIFKENPAIVESALANQMNGKTGLEEKIRTTVFTWGGLRDTSFTRLDSLKHYLKMLNAGFIALDPQQGALKAWVGGIDFRFFQYDHVTAPRQTGSVFKPFVYLAALEKGVPADTYFVNRVKVYDDFQGWAPRNSHDEYGGYYTMKGALAQSLNTVSVEVLLKAGIPQTIEIARELGISANLPNMPSLALGVASVSLQETVEAYAAIVNDGKPVKTHYLLEIADSGGYILEQFEHPGPSKPVVAPANSRAILNMLEAVVDNGTGNRIRRIYNIPGDFAGKTGTTQDNSDGWFIGLTPNLVTGCWVGADDPRVHFRTTNYGQGAYMALPIVGKFFSKTYNDPKFKNLKNSTFASPPPEMLAMLDVPQYKEVMELDERNFNLANLFKKDKDNTGGKLEEVTEVEIPQEKKEKKMWSRIKNIFRSKKK